MSKLRTTILDFNLDILGLGLNKIYTFLNYGDQRHQFTFCNHHFLVNQSFVEQLIYVNVKQFRGVLD